MDSEWDNVTLPKNTTGGKLDITKVSLRDIWSLDTITGTIMGQQKTGNNRNYHCGTVEITGSLYDSCGRVRVSTQMATTTEASGRIGITICAKYGTTVRFDIIKSATMGQGGNWKQP